MCPCRKSQYSHRWLSEFTRCARRVKVSSVNVCGHDWSFESQPLSAWLIVTWADGSCSVRWWQSSSSRSPSSGSVCEGKSLQGASVSEAGWPPVDKADRWMSPAPLHQAAAVRSVEASLPCSVLKSSGECQQPVHSYISRFSSVSGKCVHNNRLYMQLTQPLS